MAPTIISGVEFIVPGGGAIKWATETDRLCKSERETERERVEAAIFHGLMDTDVRYSVQYKRPRDI